MGKDKGGGEASAKILTKVLDSPENLRARVPKDRGGKGKGGGAKGPGQPKPDPNFKPSATDKLVPTGVDKWDRKMLRDELHKKIDDVSDLTNPDFLGKKKREPCMSAVWDRKTGDVFYNHNDRDTPVDKDKLDPLLRDRFEKWEKRDEGSGWKNDLESDQDMHGTPGMHSETRATNEALDKARKDNPDRDVKLDDFMVENASPKDKRPMPCCANCTQMIDGVNGSSAGWVHQDGKKTKLIPWDGSVNE